MVSLPHMSPEQNELVSHFTQMGEEANERSLPELLNHFDDKIGYEYLFNVATNAISKIADRVGMAAAPYFLKASNSPVSRCLASLLGLSKLRHPETLNIINRRWEDLRANISTRLILLEIFRRLENPDSVHLCLSFSSSEYESELLSLLEVLTNLVSVHGSVLPPTELDSICMIQDCVGYHWTEKKSRLPQQPSIVRTPWNKKADWKVDFGIVRDLASKELSRRGLQPPGPPTSFRRSTFGRVLPP